MSSSFNEFQPSTWKYFHELIKIAIENNSNNQSVGLITSYITIPFNEFLQGLRNINDINATHEEADNVKNIIMIKRKKDALKARLHELGVFLSNKTPQCSMINMFPNAGDNENWPAWTRDRTGDIIAPAVESSISSRLNRQTKRAISADYSVDQNYVISPDRSRHSPASGRRDRQTSNLIDVQANLAGEYATPVRQVRPRVELMPLLSAAIQDEQREASYIRRQIGLWHDNENELLSDDEQLAVSYLYEHSRTDYDDCCKNQLPSISVALSMEDRDFLQTIKILYSARKFQLNNLTIHEVKCCCCGVMWTEPGVFMKSNVKSLNKQIKYVYKNLTTSVFVRMTTIHSKDNSNLQLCEYVCKECDAQITKGETPKFSVLAGYDLGVLPPQCFIDLTLIEESLLARVQTVMHIGMLPNGTGRTQQGGIVHIDRSDTILNLATELPNLASDVLFLFLVRTSLTHPSGRDDPRFRRVRELKCLRQRVQSCLEYLIRCNPGYRGITISDKNMDQIPVDGLITPLVLDAQGPLMDHIQSLVDQGPAPFQHQDPVEVQVPTTDQELGQKTSSSVPVNIDVSGIHRAHIEPEGEWPLEHFCLVPESGGSLIANEVEADLERMRQNLATTSIPSEEPMDTMTSQANEIDPVIHTNDPRPGRFEHPYGYQTPINPCRQKFFWSMAFPSIFMWTEVQGPNGTKFDSLSDFTCESTRTCNNSFIDWLNWISNVSYRFMAHPTFAFVALAVKNRITMTSSVSYGVTTMGDQAPMTKGDILRLVQESQAAGGLMLQSLNAKLTSYAKNVIGSPAYWWDVKRKVDAMTDFFLLHHNRIPSLFITTSLAEYHEQALHRYLVKVYVRNDMQEYAQASSYLAQGIGTPSEFGKQLQKNITSGCLFLDSYAQQKHQAFVKLVLKDLFGGDVFFSKCEWASQRGMIHHHLIGYCTRIEDNLHKLMNRCVTSKNLTELHAIEEVVASEIYELMPSIFTKITAMHPSGNKRTNPDVECDTPWYKLRLKVANHNETNALIVKKVINTDYEDWPPDEVGNVDQWPSQEGIADKPTGECLRHMLHQIPMEDLQQHRINITNRVRLHACSAYCLKKSKLDKQRNSELQVLRRMECRMLFGTENPLVTSRTDGKPSSTKPCFTSIGTRTIYTAPRDHPRLVQGSDLLTSMYGANQDTQVILCPQDDFAMGSTSTDDVFKWIDNEFLAIDCMSDQQKEDLKKLYKCRDYLDKSQFLDLLKDYVTEYCCKSEKSPQQAQQMLLAVLQSDKIKDHATMTTIALTLNSKLLRSRIIPKQEAVFYCSGRYGAYKCDCTFESVSLNTGYRAIPDELIHQHVQDRPPDETPLRLNALEKFLKSQQLAYNQRMSFDLFYRNKKKTNHIICYLGGKTKATWPLTEEFAKTMVLLYKQGVRSFDDFKGIHSSYVEAFHEILNDGTTSFPPGLNAQIKRAAIAYKVDRIPGPRALVGPTHNSVVINDNDEGKGDDNGDGDGDGDDDRNIGFIDEYRYSDEVAVNNDEELYADNDVDDNHDPYIENIRTAEIGHRHDMEMLPSYEYMTTFMNSIITNSLINDARNTMSLRKRIVQVLDTETTHSLFYDPLMTVDNMGQRHLVVKFIIWLREYVKWKDSGSTTTCPKLRCVVSGGAGSGKSTIISILETIVRMVFACNSSTITFAPTGAAAIAAGAIVPDSEFMFSRSSNTDTPIKDPLKLLNLQKKYEPTVLVMDDEMSMSGAKYVGLLSSRARDVFNGGLCQDVSMGGVPCSIKLGDHGQLDPVNDIPCYKPVIPNSSGHELKVIGVQEYLEHKSNCFQLMKPMRQNLSTEFFTRLSELRTGTVRHDDIIDGALTFWDGLGERQMTNPNQLMNNTDHMYLTAFNKDKLELNMEYLSKQQNLYLICAESAGPCCTSIAHRNLGKAKAIPLQIFLAPRIPIKLKSNISVRLGLANNTRGRVVQVLYPPNETDLLNGFSFGSYPGPSHDCIVLVELEHYSGPPLSPHLNPKWVPISAITARCDRGCCYRKGIPLEVSKADSIHNFQGAQIGDSQAIKSGSVVWNKAAEVLWDEILYVAASRAMEQKNLFFRNPVYKNDLLQVGSTPRWRMRHEEIQDISSSALTLRSTDFGNNIGGRQSLVDCIKWLHARVRSHVLSRLDLEDSTSALIGNCLLQWETSLQEYLSERNGVPFLTASEDAMNDGL